MRACTPSGQQPCRKACVGKARQQVCETCGALGCAPRPVPGALTVRGRLRPRQAYQREQLVVPGRFDVVVTSYEMVIKVRALAWQLWLLERTCLLYPTAWLRRVIASVSLQAPKTLQYHLISQQPCRSSLLLTVHVVRVVCGSSAF